MLHSLLAFAFRNPLVIMPFLKILYKLLLSHLRLIFNCSLNIHRRLEFYLDWPPSRNLKHKPRNQRDLWHARKQMQKIFEGLMQLAIWKRRVKRQMQKYADGMGMESMSCTRVARKLAHQKHCPVSRTAMPFKKFYINEKAQDVEFEHQA